MKLYIDSISFTDIQIPRRMYNRPYTINTDIDTQGVLQSVVEGSYRANSKIEGLHTSLLYRCIRHQQGTGHSVYIPSSFREQQSSFVMRIIDKSSNGKDVYYITGYTNKRYSPYSDTDPGMQMYVNNIIYFSNSKRVGNFIILHTHGASYLLPRHKVIEPRDLVDITSPGRRNDVYINTKYSLDVKGRMIPIQENISSRYFAEYVARIIDRSYPDPTETVSVDKTSGYLHCMEVISLLRKERTKGLYNMLYYGDLLDLDTSVKNRTDLRECVSKKHAISVEPSMCERWDREDVFAYVAYQIAVEYLALAQLYSVAYCNIHSGDTDLRVTDFQVLDRSNVNTKYVKMLFREELKEVLLRTTRLIAGGYPSFKVTIDTFGTTYVMFKVANNNRTLKYYYSIPSVCSGLYSPLVLSEKSDIDDLSISAGVVRGLVESAIATRV